MKTRFIFNPRSGRSGRNARLLPLLRAFIAAHPRLGADLTVTEGPGHATELARAAVQAGCERVVAVGGDGTVNEIAQALRHTPAALAFVPCGSGNGLARHLGLPLSLTSSLEIAAGLRDRVALIDTGTVNGRAFFNAMGFGLDAEVSRRFNLSTRRGLPAYAATVCATFFRHRSERCIIADERGRQQADVMLAAAANSDQYGNHAVLAPGAKVDDGALDLVVVRPVSPAGAVLLGARLFLGSFDRSGSVMRLRGPRFLIERPAPGLVHTDGEVHPSGSSVAIEVQPRSLRAVVPAYCTAVAPADIRAPAGFTLQLP